MAEHEFCAFFGAGAVAGEGPFGEGFEVFLARCAGREEQEHRGGLAAVLAAATAGATFTSTQNNGASLVMALAAAVALVSYVAVIFHLR